VHLWSNIAQNQAPSIKRKAIGLHINENRSASGGIRRTAPLGLGSSCLALDPAGDFRPLDPLWIPAPQTSIQQLTLAHKAVVERDNIGRMLEVGVVWMIAVCNKKLIR